jgi:Mrp family chromosome partitioning ATPase
MSRNFELMSKALQENFMQVNSAVPEPEPEELVLGTVAQEPCDIAELAPPGPETVQLTNLVQKIFLSSDSKDAPRTLGFAAVEAGAGCSWVCARVSKILAAHVTGSVCAVDANLRTPGLDIQFGVTNGPGMNDALLHPEPLASYAQPIFGKKLWVVGSGQSRSGLDGNAISERMRSQVASLRNSFDYVLLDMPPLNKYADAIALGAICDGVILVLRANSSRRDTTLKAVADLKSANVNVLGVALNQRTFSVPDSIYRRL